MNTEDSSFPEDDAEELGQGGQEEAALPEEGADPAATGPSDKTRRDLIISIGTVAFSFTVVGAFGGNPEAQTPVGPARIPVEPACWFSDEPDRTCEGPDGDCDANTAVTSDRDESCGDDGETDEACALVPSSNASSSSQDTDENCGSGDQDQACGDCNDNHDSDQNCGGTISGGGGADSDELCGHQHYVGGAEDQACNATTPDAGCGAHNATYAGGWTDEDQHCTGGNADQNCTSTLPDETCNTGGGSYSTSPDEGCSSSDADNACGAGGSVNGDASYDADESCSSTQADESCGAGGIPVIGGGDTDEHA